MPDICVNVACSDVSRVRARKGKRDRFEALRWAASTCGSGRNAGFARRSSVTPASSIPRPLSLGPCFQACLAGLGGEALVSHARPVLQLRLALPGGPGGLVRAHGGQPRQAAGAAGRELCATGSCRIMSGLWNEDKRRHSFSSFFFYMYYTIYY